MSWLNVILNEPTPTSLISFFTVVASASSPKLHADAARRWWSADSRRPRHGDAAQAAARNCRRSGEAHDATELEEEERRRDER